MAAIPIEKLFDKKQIIWTIFADDEPNIRTVYGGFLTDLLRSNKPTIQDPRRYMVRIVDGKSAAEEQYTQLIKEGHKVGLVLTDRNMEYDNAGFDLLKTVQAQDKHTRRAMLTGFPEYTLLGDGTIHSFLVKASSVGSQEHELRAVVLAELRNFFDNEELMAVARNHYDDARAVSLANDALQAELTRADGRIITAANEQGQRALGMRYLMSEFGTTRFNVRVGEYLNQLLGTETLITVGDESVASYGFKVTSQGVYYKNQALSISAAPGEYSLGGGLYVKSHVYSGDDGKETNIMMIIKSGKKSDYVFNVLGDLLPILTRHVEASRGPKEHWQEGDGLSDSLASGSGEQGNVSLYNLGFSTGELEPIEEVFEGPVMTIEDLVALVKSKFTYTSEDTEQVMMGRTLCRVDNKEFEEILNAYQTFFADIAEDRVVVEIRNVPLSIEILFQITYKHAVWEMDDQLNTGIADLERRTTKAACVLYSTQYIDFGKPEETTRTSLKELTEDNNDVLAVYTLVKDDGYFGEPTKMPESVYQSGRMDVPKASALQLQRNPALLTMFGKVNSIVDLLKENSKHDPPMFNTSGEYKLVIYK